MAEVRVCSVNDVPVNSSRRFDIGDLRLAVVRIGEDWYVIGDECSHANYSLSEGDVWPDECEIECPKHGSTFSLKTGEPMTLPATKPVPTYTARVEGDAVFIEVPDNA